MTDWEERYRETDTPWDKGVPSPGLVDFLATEASPQDQRVLVPGCGMGHDARAFAESGWSATGLDLAPSAVECATALHSGASGALEFRCNDFLKDGPAAPFDLVFEHTLFCAIDPEDREKYVAAVRRWLRQGGRYLAIFYLLTDPEGPPFPTDSEEVMRRFSVEFELVREWTPRSFSHREGLELMTLWQG